MLALRPQGGDLDWVCCLPLEHSTVAGTIGHCRNVASGSPTAVPMAPKGCCLCLSQGLLLGLREEPIRAAFQPVLV